MNNNSIDNDNVDDNTVYVIEDDSSGMVMYARGDFLKAVYSHPAFLEIVVAKNTQEEKQ